MFSWRIVRRVWALVFTNFSWATLVDVVGGMRSSNCGSEKDCFDDYSIMEERDD